MILLALALAAQGQWTGPRTVEYRGPGNFSAGGYRVSLGKGERALVLPQDTGGQGVRRVLRRGEGDIHAGTRPAPAPLALRDRGARAVPQQGGAAGGSSDGAGQTSF